MHKQHSRIGILVSLVFHIALLSSGWLLIQNPKPVLVEEVSSISLEMIAARVEQPQVATAPESGSVEEERVQPKQEPEIEPEPILKPDSQPQIEPKPKKQKPKEKKEKPKKEKPVKKPQVKAVEKAKEVKQGIIAKAIPATQGNKPQTGAENASTAGSTSLGSTSGENSSASTDEINAYKVKLRRALQQKASSVYPKREKMMRKTGIVTLRFTLSATGSITDVSVYKSSGNGNLDIAAVKAAQRTTPPIPPKGFPSAITVPVKFSLN